MSGWWSLIVRIAALAALGLLAVACGGDAATPTPTRPAATPTPITIATIAIPTATPTLAPTVGATPTATAVPTYRWGMSAARAAEWAKIEEAADKEGTVTGYWNTSITPEILPKLVAAFAKDHPKIKFDLIPGQPSDIISRVVAEQQGGKYVGDVGQMGITTARTLYVPGYTEAFIPPATQDPLTKWLVDPRAWMRRGRARPSPANWPSAPGG